MDYQPHPSNWWGLIIQLCVENNGSEGGLETEEDLQSLDENDD